MTISLKNSNDLLGTEIPEILMNIMACHGFSKYRISTVIFTCPIIPVPWYFFKGFIIVETEKGGPDNIAIMSKQQINAFNYINKTFSLHAKRKFHQLTTHLKNLSY